MDLTRLAAQIVKELLCVLRDPKSRIILFVPPLIQLVILSFAVTLDVRNVSLVVRDLDGGPAAHELVGALDAAAFTGQVRPVFSQTDVHSAIDTGTALAAVVIPEGFSGDVAAGRPTEVQVLVDGRRANSGQIVLGYVQTVAAGVPVAGSLIGPPEPASSVRHWFNPTLDYKWFVVPSLAGVLLTFTALLLTALSIARERELGTFDQLMVSPTTPAEMIIAKSVPALLIGPALSLLMMLAAVVVFQVPFMGNPLIVALAMVLFVLANIGIGLMVSAVSETQQQAILGTFAIGVPTILMSGFATPVENMPSMLQWIAEAIPTRHILVILQGSFLKGQDFAAVWPHLWPMALLAAITLPAASLLVRSRLQ
jgi:ABC-2 type transport system permease protein